MTIITPEAAARRRDRGAGTAMAAGVRRPGPRLSPRLSPITAALGLTYAFAPLCQAQMVFSPAVDLRETYTDNVSLAPADQARGQFVTEVAPGFSLSDKTSRLTFNAAYQMHLYEFSGAAAQGENHAQSQLQASAKARLVDELLFLDATAAVSQQATSAFGPQTNDNAYTTVNRNEVRTFSLSPYLQHSFGNDANMALRYTRDLVDTDNAGFGRSQADTVYAGLNSGAAFRQFGWGLMLTRQNLDDSIGGDSSSESAAASLRYALVPTFNLTASGGYDRYDYGGLGGINQGKSWSAGFGWEASPRTNLQASVGRHYYGASNTLTALHRSRNTVWNIHYGNEVTTTRSQFLLPATVNTADLLNNLFSSSIADPAMRQQAVDAYIKATGLPPSLANNINYFSNRYLLLRQLQLSAAFNTARTTTVLSIYDTHQTALSAQQVDSSLLGATDSTLNDNTTQKGLDLALNWRMNSRSGATLTGDYSTTRSLSTGLISHNRALRLGFTHQFQPRLGCDVELRHVRGDGLIGTGSYTENAITATLTLKL
jgi:uncharacterized protein (PEP-CTERM system associated)